jgi:hypothetical protein
MMDKWRWRIVLAAVGFLLFACSLCLLTTSRLQIHRIRDTDIVPIEAPPVPDSRSLHLGVV